MKPEIKIRQMSNYLKTEIEKAEKRVHEWEKRADRPEDSSAKRELAHRFAQDYRLRLGTLREVKNVLET